MAEPVLTIEGLSVDYEVGAGRFQALRDVSLTVPTGRVVGIVGETGCGKSTLAHSVARLFPEPPARIVGGRIRFQGIDILELPKWRLPEIRGTGIGMIFQEPLNSLNPSFRVYDQVAEAVKIRRFRDEFGKPIGSPARAGAPFDYSKPPREPRSVAAELAKPLLPGGPVAAAAKRPRESKEVREEVLEYLRLVRINDPETILGLYPHELSGGMRQRIMIAMALSEKPALLVADEPTSALDVTIQAQVLTLMKELIEEVHASILFISHDLGVIAETADELGVMYAGHLVEYGPVEEIFQRPRHPYTKALLRAIPDRYKSEGELLTIPGSVPNLSRPPAGCTFHPRCPLVQPICRSDPSPPLRSLDEGRMVLPPHRSACHFAEQVGQLP